MIKLVNQARFFRPPLKVEVVGVAGVAGVAVVAGIAGVAGVAGVAGISGIAGGAGVADLRYKNHDTARRLEEPLLTSVHHKRAVLQVSALHLILQLPLLLLLLLLPLLLLHLLLLLLLLPYQASLCGELGSLNRRSQALDTQVGGGDKCAIYDGFIHLVLCIPLVLHNVPSNSFTFFYP